MRTSKFVFTLLAAILASVFTFALGADDLCHGDYDAIGFGIAINEEVDYHFFDHRSSVEAIFNFHDDSTRARKFDLVGRAGGFFRDGEPGTDAGIAEFSFNFTHLQVHPEEEIHCVPLESGQLDTDQIVSQGVLRYQGETRHLVAQGNHQGCGVVILHEEHVYLWMGDPDDPDFHLIGIFSVRKQKCWETRTEKTEPIPPSPIVLQFPPVEEDIRYEALGHGIGYNDEALWSLNNPLSKAYATFTQGESEDSLDVVLEGFAAGEFLTCESDRDAGVAEFEIHIKGVSLDESSGKKGVRIDGAYDTDGESIYGVIAIFGQTHSVYGKANHDGLGAIFDGESHMYLWLVNATDHSIGFGIQFSILRHDGQWYNTEIGEVVDGPNGNEEGSDGDVVIADEPKLVCPEFTFEDQYPLIGHGLDSDDLYLTFNGENAKAYLSYFTEASDVQGQPAQLLYHISGSVPEYRKGDGEIVGQANFSLTFRDPIYNPQQYTHCGWIGRNNIDNVGVVASGILQTRQGTRQLVGLGNQEGCAIVIDNNQNFYIKMVDPEDHDFVLNGVMTVPRDDCHWIDTVPCKFVPEESCTKYRLGEDQSSCETYTAYGSECGEYRLDRDFASCTCTYQVESVILPGDDAASCSVERVQILAPVSCYHPIEEVKSECFSSTMNLFGGFKLVNGAPEYVGAALKTTDFVEIAGETKSAGDWLKAAEDSIKNYENLWEADEIERANIFSTEAMKICEGLNIESGGRGSEFWNMTELTIRHYPQTNGPGTVDDATICFEDLYPQPGDADYNDLCFIMRIDEIFDSNGHLLMIEVSVTPKSRGAGYDHALFLNLDGLPSNPKISDSSTPVVVGDYTATLRQFDKSGAETYQNQVTGSDDLELIRSTYGLLPEWNTNPHDRCGAPGTVRASIMVHNPELNSIVNRSHPNIPFYRPIMKVHNTDQFIDVVDVNPNFIDSNGFPFGIVIPDMWKWPHERKHIDDGYPLFSLYRDCLVESPQHPCRTNQTIQQWYRVIADESVVYSYDPTQCS